ncbi:MAG: hypothetical protein EBT97_09490 [Actinobacteria bacterium]|nr:hypothetical protein [Actinomycetota bacterium]
MPLRAVPLLPAGGLDLTYTDDRAVERGMLRGMTNFRVVDGELWMREGEKARRRDIISNGWAHAVSLDLQYGNDTHRRHFLISQWGVLEVDLSTWALSVPYSDEYSGTIKFTNGQGNATLVSTDASKSIANGHILIAPDADGQNTAYYVTAYTGTGAGATISLDRAYAGASGTVTCKGYPTFGRPSNEKRRRNHFCTWTVFRQALTLAEGAVWNTGATTAPWYTEKSPAVTAGGIYLVVCPGWKRSGVPTGPFAIRMDATEKIKGEIMRQTVTSITSAAAFGSDSVPSFCETWQGRLFVVREDENDKNGDRCIWFSQDGNLLYWHNGTVGTNATHARERFGEGHDPITALKLLGDDLIVHRARSQNVLSKTGSAATPFRNVRNDQGLGFISSHSIQTVRGVQYGWTDYGPAIYDGSQMALMPKPVLRIASMMRSTAEWSQNASGEGYPYSIASAYHAPRQQIWWLVAGTTDYWENNYGDGEFGSQVLVLDLQQLRVWRYTYKIGFSLGVFRDETTGQEWVMRSRPGGTMVQATQTNRGKDAPSLVEDDANPDEPLCYAEFAWNDCQSPFRKSIHKVQVELRGWSNDGTWSDDYIDDVNVGNLATDPTYQLTIHTDHDVSESPFNGPVTVPKARYTDGRDLSEGTRLVPTLITIPKPYLHGEVFKVRIANHGPDVSNSRPLRISQLILWVQDQVSGDEPTRRERVD